MGKIDRKKHFVEQHRQYYATIKEKPTLYIEVSHIEKPMIHLTVENMLVLFLLDTYHLHKLFDIKFVFVTTSVDIKNQYLSEGHVVNGDKPKDCGDNLLVHDNNNITNFVKYESEYYFEDQVISIIKNSNNKNETNTNTNLNTNASDGTIENFHPNEEGQNDMDSQEVWNCKNPSIYISDKKSHIAGLASVLRFIISFATRNDPFISKNEPFDIEKNKLRQFPEIPLNILGHNENCLVACAESSLWTKFCEHDIVNMVGTCQRQLLELVTSITTSQQTTTTIATATCDTGMLVNSGLVHPENTPSSHTENQIQLPEQLKIPVDLIRLENHLRLPSKIHNFRKRLAQIVVEQPPAENNSSLKNQHETNNGYEEKENQSKENEKEIVDKIVVKQKEGKNVREHKKRVFVDKLPREVPHDYAEGPDLVLSDLLLFPCIDIVLSVLGNDSTKYLPLVYKYHQRLCKTFPLHPKVSFQAEDLSPSRFFPILAHVQIIVPEIQSQSLYKSDTQRYNPKSRIFTRQNQIEDALKVLSQRGIDMLSLDETKMPPFEWSSLPLLLHPEGGELPISRIEKKAHQLSNLVQRVEKVYYDKYDSITSRKIKIVDFCSGAGHLGILLAYILPKCEVVLVENKQQSLKKAEKRVHILGLKNVSFYQCNLDYFTGSFDIGVACHACGTATDLVLTRCIEIQASFVCSPCCYGSNKMNHILDYPRSSIFSNTVKTSDGLFSLKHYFVLCHAADQTHGENEKNNQGKMCMRLIDTDRCLHAQENNYRTSMSIMEPPTCSPKNHIIVGVPN